MIKIFPIQSCFTQRIFLTLFLTIILPFITTIFFLYKKDLESQKKENIQLVSIFLKDRSHYIVTKILEHNQWTKDFPTTIVKDQSTLPSIPFLTFSPEGTSLDLYRKEGEQIVYTPIPLHVAKKELFFSPPFNDFLFFLSSQSDTIRLYPKVPSLPRKDLLTKEIPLPYSNLLLGLEESTKPHLIDWTQFLLEITGALLGMLLVGTVICIAMLKKMNAPMANLLAMIEGLGKGEKKVRYIATPFGFEINIIGKALNTALDTITAINTQRKKETKKRKMYQGELSIGKEMQQAILPNPPQLPYLRVQRYFYPAQSLGGDFYDFFHKNGLFITIGDVAGKGAGAALYSLMIRSMLRLSIDQGHTQPGLCLKKIARNINDLLFEDTEKNGMFATTLLTFFDPMRSEFSYLNCGHLPPLIVTSAGKITSLNQTGIALGIVSSVNWPKTMIPMTIPCHPGDTLIFYTDGLTERENQKGEILTTELFYHWIQEGRRQEHLGDYLIKKAKKYTHPKFAVDDTTLLILKIQ